MEAYINFYTCFHLSSSSADSIQVTRKGSHFVEFRCRVCSSFLPECVERCLSQAIVMGWCWMPCLIFWVTEYIFRVLVFSQTKESLFQRLSLSLSLTQACKVAFHCSRPDRYQRKERGLLLKEISNAIEIDDSFYHISIRVNTLWSVCEFFMCT